MFTLCLINITYKYNPEILNIFWHIEKNHPSLKIWEQIFTK